RTAHAFSSSYTCSMESPRVEQKVDRAQVKKAAQALQAYLKSISTSQKLFQSDCQPISLLFTLWKIPNKQQTIRISLPHGLRTNSGEVCLFTKDEPNMDADQTTRFYKKLLTERGVKHNIEVIPLKSLKTEYKPFEAKRRLLGNFDLFLSDARIHRILPSQIGKHFYERKKNPLSVDLESKHLARDLEKIIQGTTLSISNKGSCCMSHVSHSGMTTEEIVDNVIAVVSAVMAKLASGENNIKIIHLKSQNSAALPIYTSDLSHLVVLDDAQKKAKLARKVKKVKKSPVLKEVKEDDEEVPQLVPIEMPANKKQEEGSKNKMKTVPRPAAGKKRKKTMKVNRKKTSKRKKVIVKEVFV
ncbi:hypothetical protein DNTS_034025, partial [Danionella cerebrum]